MSKVGIVQSQSEALVQDARKGLEPRWPAAIALLAVGGLRLALPGSLSAGPSWMLLVVVGVLMVPIVWAYYCGFDALHGILGYVVTSIVTADMVWSLFFTHSRDSCTQRASAGYVAIRSSFMDYQRTGVCLLVLAA